MNTDNLAERAVRAIISGLIAGVIVALLLYVIHLIAPAFTVDPSTWGLIVGILTALYVFVTGYRTRV